MAVNWTQGLLQGYGLYDQLDRLSNISDKAVTGTNDLAEQATSATSFKPFTVTSGFGQSGMDAQGNLNYELNPFVQQGSNDYLGYGNTLFGEAMAPTAEREGDVYDRIRATQLPEEERAQMLMNDRLGAQGRSGIRSDAYGGTPEQLAYHKAVQESQNNASLMSLQQAQQERMQNTQMGGMMQNAAFLPYAQLQNMTNQGLAGANMRQAGDIAGANLSSQLGLGGLQTSLNADVARANLLGNFYNSTANAVGSNGVDPVGGAIGWIKELLSGSGVDDGFLDQAESDGAFDGLF